MKICVLCKVVDNFGDIGVVWRLCRQLKTVDASLEINLVVDDLQSFNKICSEVRTNVQNQTVDEIEVWDWKADAVCHEAFSKADGERLSVILECFQCGRPEWMEKILFEEKLQRTVHIVMIDYLTAEQYAEDFHCLKSLTRSSKVQKVNFMPGFTGKTGGLIIDEQWKNLQPRNADGDILVFTYERDWTGLAQALAEAGLKVKVARGRGFDSFVESCEKIENSGNERVKLEKLEYLNQDEWDKMMMDCSLLFIRGEESMSRACLSGIPFVWHAYPQSDEYQMVKVNALLERMKRHFRQENFSIVRDAWLAFNRPQGEVSDGLLKSACLKFINARDRLEYGFKDFALDLRKNGDLANNLVTFIRKLTII